jgi:hypothetical protein
MRHRRESFNATPRMRLSVLVLDKDMQSVAEGFFLVKLLELAPYRNGTSIVRMKFDLLFTVSTPERVNHKKKVEHEIKRGNENKWLLGYL